MGIPMLVLHLRDTFKECNSDLSCGERRIGPRGGDLIVVMKTEHTIYIFANEWESSLSPALDSAA